MKFGLKFINYVSWETMIYSNYIILVYFVSCNQQLKFWSKFQWRMQSVPPIIYVLEATCVLEKYLGVKILLKILALVYWHMFSIQTNKIFVRNKTQEIYYRSADRISTFHVPLRIQKSLIFLIMIKIQISRNICL